MYEAEGRGAIALSCFRRAARDACEYGRAEFVALFDALCARHGALRGHRGAAAMTGTSDRSSAIAMDEEEAAVAAEDAEPEPEPEPEPEAEAACAEDAEEEDADIFGALARAHIACAQAALRRGDVDGAAAAFERAAAEIGEEEPMPEDGAPWCVAWHELRLGGLAVEACRADTNAQRECIAEELAVLARSVRGGDAPCAAVECEALVLAASLLAAGCARSAGVWARCDGAPAEAERAAPRAPSLPPLPDEKALKKCKVAELKQLLKARCLPCSGRKADLVARLLEGAATLPAPPIPPPLSSSAACPALSVAEAAADAARWAKARTLLDGAEAVARSR